MEGHIGSVESGDRPTAVEIRRPPRILAAGAVLIASGIVAGVASTRLISFGSILAVAGTALAAMGAVEIAAGLGVIRLREWARTLGMAIASVSVVFQAAFIPLAPLAAPFLVLAYGFVFWALLTGREALAPARPRR